MLVKIIERVSGLSYADFIEQRLLVPNGLNDTSIPYLGTDQKIPDPFVSGSVINSGQVSPWTEDNMSLNLGEGNIISTPAELATWVKLLITGAAGLSQETIAAMTTCASETEDSGCYGLGIWEESSPVFGVGHTGAHAGYLSLMLYDPNHDVTAIVFASLLNYDNIMDELQLLLTVREKAYEALNIQ